MLKVFFVMRGWPRQEHHLVTLSFADQPFLQIKGSLAIDLRFTSSPSLDDSLGTSMTRMPMIQTVVPRRNIQTWRLWYP